MLRRIIGVFALVGISILLFACGSKAVEKKGNKNDEEMEVMEESSREFSLGELTFIAPDNWENESSDTLITLHPFEDESCSIVIYKGPGNLSETLDHNLQEAYAGLSSESWVTDFYFEDLQMDGQPAKSVTCRMAAEGEDELSKGYYFPAGDTIDYVLFVAKDHAYEQYLDDFETMVKTFHVPEHEFK